MSNSPKVEKAVKEVFEELMALPEEEFFRACEKARQYLPRELLFDEGDTKNYNHHINSVEFLRLT